MKKQIQLSTLILFSFLLFSILSCGENKAPEDANKIEDVLENGKLSVLNVKVIRVVADGDIIAGGACSDTVSCYSGASEMGNVYINFCTNNTTSSATTSTNVVFVINGADTLSATVNIPLGVSPNSFNTGVKMTSSPAASMTVQLGTFSTSPLLPCR